MAIKRNVLAESGATVQAEDGTTIYATIQMRHGKESDMDKSKFVPAEMGVATDTKKAFMAFGSNQVKEMMFREDSEIEELLGEVREISDKAVEAVESAETTAKQTIQDFTDQMKATIPEDYTAISQDITDLKSDLNQLEDDIYYEKPSVNLFKNYKFEQLTVDNGKFVIASTLKGFYIPIEPNQNITIERINTGNRFRFILSSEKPSVGVAFDTNRVIYVDDSSNKGTIYSGDNHYLYVIFYSSSLDTLNELELLDGMTIYYGSEWKEGITKAYQYRRYINVKEFGALGDGVTDDSDAIQKALNYLLNGEQRTLYFPQGTYMVSKTITIPTQTKLIGIGNTSIIKLMHDHELTRYVWREEASESDLSHKYRSAVIFTDKDTNSIVIENMVFSGDDTIESLASECQSGLVLQGINHCIKNCYFIDFNYLSDTESWNNRDTITANSPGFGLHVFNCNRTKIEHCYFARNGYQGVGTDRSENISFSDCYFGNGNRTAFQLHQGAKNISVVNSVFNNQSPNSHIQLTFHGVPGDLSIDGLKVSNCQINGNIVDVLGYEHNIQFANCRFVSDTTFSDGPTENGDIYGNKQGTPHKWIFIGNIFENIEGYYPKLSIKCDRLFINGNIFSTPNRNPILINGGDTIMVSNNILYIDRDNNGTAAVNAEDATNAHVSNNHIIYTS